MTSPLDTDIYKDPGVARFYDPSHGWDQKRADFDYCASLAEDAGSVLDLGCGTGELIAALAQDRRAAGVDGAAPMLEIARQRPGGDRVDWVHGDARTVRLDRTFDLIVLTGHAFQVFLTDADQAAALATIAAHLAPDGRFIFDSRDPTYPAPKEQTKDESHRVVEHPELGPTDRWCVSTYDTASQILTYTNTYRVQRTGETNTASDQIRYTPYAELAARIEAAGLTVDRWLGDWHGTPYQPAAKDIIPIGRLA